MDLIHKQKNILHLYLKKNKRLLLDFFVDRIKSALSNVCVLELEDILIN